MLRLDQIAAIAIMAIKSIWISHMIKVVKDDAGPQEPKESCALCTRPTNYWYEPRDVAVCQECAKTASVADVPTKREWLIANGDTLPESWVCDADKRRRKKPVPPATLPAEVSTARTEIYASSAGIERMADNLIKKAAQYRANAKLERWKGAPKWANVLIGPLPESHIDPGDYRWGEYVESTCEVFFGPGRSGCFLLLVDGQSKGYTIIESKPS